MTRCPSQTAALQRRMDSELACYDKKEILNLLNILNDCIWCTNLFITESYLEEKVRRQGLCHWKWNKQITADEVYKELCYIELLLDRLKNQIKTEPYDDTNIIRSKNPLNQKISCEDGRSGECHEKSYVIEGEVNEDNVPENNKTERTCVRIDSGERCEDNQQENFDWDTEKCDEQTENVKMQVSLVIHKLNDIELRKDISSKQKQINKRISDTNKLLEPFVNNGVFDGQLKSMEEIFRRRRDENRDVQLIRTPGNKCAKFWKPFRVRHVDSLLFEKEKWRIEVVQRNGGDPLEHLCGISVPLQYESFKLDTRSTYYGIKRKNLLSISLQTADMSDKISRTRFKKLFSLIVLFLSFGLYFTDMVSDLVLAGEYFFQGNIHYGTLTLIVVFGPLVAETLSKLILKVLGWDKEYGRLKWKDVFNCNDLKIVKWMVCSIKYSVNSMRDYTRFGRYYGELHSHRCSKGKNEYVGAWYGEGDSNYIQTVFRSMLAWNERFVLQTWLAESLNESAPQLLLQLTIVVKKMMEGSDIGPTTWVCIATSVLSFSWSIHLAHYNRHYREGGKILNNSYKKKGRTLEFIGNCFVYGSRFTAICLMISMLGWVAIAGLFVYLAIIYVLMIWCSARKEIYKTLHRYKTTIFWPLHRIFTVPYRIGIWRMDSLDHLLFYLEIVCMALSVPFIMPEEVGSTVPWIISGSVLICETIGVALLFLFKRFLHPYGYICENR
ncbi:hypothetical protein J437_LFUL011358 [Ladona fulva]|uniref:XK-related protein n=1 Tax=Ladona fulva TaxID=123851 RepID=A0A8K0P4N7_LADFU|nr:hypothetical protein J437_LFUL011358 [Ladona fulva]